MRSISSFFALILFSAVFMSCESVKVYTKEQRSFYIDDQLVSDSYTHTKSNEDNSNKKIIENTSTSIKKISFDKSLNENDIFKYSGEDVEQYYAIATTKINSNEKFDTVSIKLYNTSYYLLADKIYIMKKGKFVDPDKIKEPDGQPSRDKNVVAARNSQNVNRTPAINMLLDEAFSIYKNEKENSSGADINSNNDNTRVVTSTERITVRSKPNSEYIVYSILGKPFVIAGSSALNLVKCAGYGLINFAGGYATVANGELMWKMPDYKGAKAKAEEARASNGIEAYPEYHVPFTDNHIIVESLETEKSSETVDMEGGLKITAQDKREYDQSIKVERSAKADAYSTAAVASLIGTAVAIPVSGITWLGGAFIAAYSKTQ